MNQFITKLPKNSVEEIRISLTKFRQHELVDLRVYFSPQEGAEPIPTRKGISLSIKYLPGLIKALKEIEQRLSEEGLNDKA